MRIVLLTLLLALTTNAYAQRSAAALGSISIDAIEMGGNITADADNTYDIGEIGTRFNDGFFGGQLACGAGSAAAPGLMFSTDINTGLYTDAADTLSVSTGGTSIATFRDTRLGINVNGTAATPALTVGDADTGLYRVGNDILGITAGGTRRAQINTFGLALEAADLSAAGSTQGTAAATANTSLINSTGATGTQGVILPSPGEGSLKVIFNSGAGVLKLYPQVGGAINAAATNAAVDVAAGAMVVCYSRTSTTWRCGEMPGA